ncbi:phosphomannomutase/phosphoglucomutase [Pseudomonas gingeri]|nr:phosphomannomutase/phosphoglucomutase [Pseudomonas gingeri]NWA17486.1 phosphomannomutase/phosphoglucomutase [Pseudomonas gingeri]NWA58675.1 phosphomannomutase/phosphoglucomutase [Pseudomonas gingeri]NWA96954.1 phosphomannomutase/phosphoglucomutase [Pseudomonas gingeri]NWB05514.1 phosphomannomutase/phosphoglucomutase [Pseudomonas gingeri]
MKGLKRSAKTANGPEHPDHSASNEVDNPLLPGLKIALGGLLLAAALLWFGVLAPWNQTFRLQLAQTGGAVVASTLAQATTDLIAQTDAAALNPALLKALQSQNADTVKAAEDSLRYMNGLVDVQLNLRDAAQPVTDRAAPLNFSALDLIRRAERGTRPPPEAYKVGQRWLVYSVATLGETTDARGTLLLVFDLQRLLKAFGNWHPDSGSLQLTQSILGSPEQVLDQRGNAASGDSYPFSTNNTNWALKFSPGPAFQFGYPISTYGLMLLTMLVVLGSTALAIRLTHKRLQDRLDGDARQLEQLFHELSGGKAVKAFSLSLPALNGLAQDLARFSLRNGQPAAAANNPGIDPGSTTSSAPAPIQTVTPGAEWIDPLFQDTDILDIDILDENQDFLRTEHPLAMNSITRTAPTFPDSIFRAYDIRGTIPETLTAETAYWIGRAIGSQSLAQGEPNVCVGRDGRLSGPELVRQLIQGLHDSGCHVSDVGLVPTPALYYAANVLAGKSGVMLTGSHNPSNYNGFKIVIAGDTLANEQIQALHTRLKTNDLSSGKGSIEKVDILDRYFQQIREDIVLAKKLKVVVDCGNGAAGVIAPQLIEALGCEVIPLFCDVDGNFPNHHPDPGKPENLEDLIAKVKETNADLGLAFDGDGDRVGVVTNTGNIVFPDRLLMLFAKDVVSRNPGADIIFDVKCTRRLTPLIQEYGGRPVMWKTGHSLIKKKMKQSGALLAGEMSGHIFFKERWFGFDDGIYSAARLLEILSQEKSSAEELFATFPNDISTPEININVTDESKFSIIEALHDAQWGDANLTTIDGVRVDYPKGWGLVRASNTTPVLVLRFEADTEAELQRIKDVFHAQLKRVAPDLQLPF